MISLLLFFLLLSSGSVFMTARFGRKFEETVPLSIFCAVEIIFLFGLVDSLRLGYIIACLLGIMLYWQGIRSVKYSAQFCRNFFTPAFYLLAICAIVILYGTYGMIVMPGDEVYFWALATKQYWAYDVFHCVPGHWMLFPEYPPGMQLWQYCALALDSSFADWKMQFAYLIYIAALFLPFLKKTTWKQWPKILLAGAAWAVGSSIIVSGSLSIFTRLLVDPALGMTFAYAMAKVLLLEIHPGKKIDWFDIFDISMAINMLNLLKAAGKLFAALVVAALIFRFLVLRMRRVILGATQLERIMVTCMIALPWLTAAAWNMKYTYYQQPQYFDAQKYNLVEFIGVLTGRLISPVAYRNRLPENFLRFLIEEKVVVGRFQMTNFQFLLLIVPVMMVILFLLRKKVVGTSIVIFTMLSGWIIYAVGLLASYMYTFPEYEAPYLPSMQRYLNIYHLAFLTFFIFLLLRVDWKEKWNARFSGCVLAGILCLSTWTDARNFLTRKAVSNSVAQTDQTIQLLAEQMNQISQPTGTTSSVIRINCEADVWYIVFPYMILPKYNVVSTSSFGSKPLDENDTFTQILTSDEFLDYVLINQIKYIAIHNVSQDFVTTYQSLFNSPLVSGQVYLVTDEKIPFQLLD